MIVRDATDADMASVKNIYNALIATTSTAWTELRQTLRQRRAWFRRQQRADHPVLVAESSGAVIGFAAYGSFRGSGKWAGYRHARGAHDPRASRALGDRRRSCPPRRVDRTRKAD